MNSSAALYSRGSLIVAGVVERSTRASCIVLFLTFCDVPPTPDVPEV